MDVPAPKDIFPLPIRAAVSSLLLIEGKYRMVAVSPKNRLGGSRSLSSINRSVGRGVSSMMAGIIRP